MPAEAAEAAGTAQAASAEVAGLFSCFDSCADFLETFLGGETEWDDITHTRVVGDEDIVSFCNVALVSVEYLIRNFTGLQEALGGRLRGASI